MSAFTPAEIAYLQGQRLGRIATLGPSGAPHVVPLGFTFNAELDTIDISGYQMGSGRKFHDVEHDGRVAFVVDDVLPPWQPRGIEMQGEAEAIPADDPDKAIIRIRPRHIVGWGIDTYPYKRNSRTATER